MTPAGATRPLVANVGVISHIPSDVHRLSEASILGATILDCTPGATSSFERESNVLQFNSHWHCFLTGG